MNEQLYDLATYRHPVPLWLTHKKTPAEDNVICNCDRYKIPNQRYFTLLIVVCSEISPPRLSNYQWRTQEFFRGGVQQIQLKTEDREIGDLGR